MTIAPGSYLAGNAIQAPPPPVMGVYVRHDLIYPEQVLRIVDRYEHVTIRNRQAVDISERITKMSLALSAQEQSQLTIEIEDTDFRLLGSGIFQGQPHVNYQGLQLELAGVGTINRGRGALRLAARSAKVQALKRRRGPLTVLGDERGFVGYECQQVGLPFVSQEDAQDVAGLQYGARVSRDWQQYVSTIQAGDEVPSSWTTFKRLAQQKGWMMFESGNVLYFAAPSWFFTHAEVVRVRWAGTAKQVAAKPPKPHTSAYGVVMDDQGQQYWRSLLASGDYDPGVIDLLEVPEFDHSQDRVETTVTFKVAAGYEQHFMPGKVVDVEGIPFFGGLYLIQTVAYDLDGSDVTVTAQTSIDPQPEQGGTFNGFSAAAGHSSAIYGGGLDLTGSASDQRGLPVCGLTVPRFLKGLRTVESSGNYKARPPFAGGPSGAYQYIKTTWQGAAGGARSMRWPEAYLAPPNIQDAVAEEGVRVLLKAYGNDWGKVAVHHMYPAGADNPSVWKYEPYAEPGHPPRPPGWHPGMNPTMIAYARKVLQKAGGVSCGQYDTSTAGSRAVPDAPHFVAKAVSQAGIKPYQQTTAINYLHTANPSVFDCSSLVQWALAMGCGIRNMPRNSGDQWQHCKGMAISVSKALKIRGALLWIDGGGRPGGEHVAISMGDGRDMAAHSPSMGLSILPTSARAWSRAALVPGLFYPGISPNPGAFYKEQAMNARDD
jgi:cell wall-associated NlpC family hydrolase